MYLQSISLQNFRNYTKSEFEFSNGTTFIVGPNASGKTNVIESIYCLSNGKSFRAEKDSEMIQFGKEIARVKGKIAASGLEAENLELVLTNGFVNGSQTPLKKYLVNGVSKRRVDFAGNLSVVLFSPVDLDIIVGSPSLRRRFLDEVLEQVDYEYRLALSQYTKGLRQRNALLERTKEAGVRNEKQFEFWDNELIKHGGTITKKRGALIEFINRERKTIFDCVVFYDKSIISKERLLQYKDAELGAGVTLVGPHRDDFSIHMYNNTQLTTHDIKLFGSRGQQRLTVLQLKCLQLSFIEKMKGERPILLLDDIFSELDEKHIHLVLDIVGKQQTIITSTHEELVPKKLLKSMQLISLKNSGIA